MRNERMNPKYLNKEKKARTELKFRKVGEGLASARRGFGCYHLAKPCKLFPA